MDQSTPSNGEVNNKWRYTYAPTVRLRGAEMGNFRFTFAVSASGYTQSSGSARVKKVFDRAWKDMTAFYCTFLLSHLSRGTEENHNKS